MNNILKQFLCLTLTILSLNAKPNIEAKSKKINPLLISCIKNKSKSLIKIKAYSRLKHNDILEVKPHFCIKSKKNCLSIPFISINSYIKEFVKDIHFIPKQALKVSIQNKIYALWHNEEGLVCSPVSTKSNKSQIRCLLSKYNLEKYINKKLQLLLEINSKEQIQAKLL